MSTMVKLRVIRNRLGLGSWRIPFARSRHASLDQRNKKSSSVASHLATDTPSQSPSSPVPRSVASTSKLIELAQIISKETEKLDGYLKANGHPEPSFAADAPTHFPKISEELKKSREEVMRATKELGELVTGPYESLRWMAWDVSTCYSSETHYITSMLIYSSTTTHFLSTQYITTS